MKYCGYDVFQEFYINDAGNQINKLGKSLEVRVRQLQGENIELEEDMYPGEYLIDCAKRYIEQKSTMSYADFAKADMLRLQKELLEKFGTHFDLFFSELSLYENKEVESCMETLKKSGKIYEKDGATWFRSSDYEDDQDRVLIKTDGKNTYLTADIAYHKNKLDRGFERLINIWGADHHGYIPRMKAAIDALGYDNRCNQNHHVDDTIPHHQLFVLVYNKHTQQRKYIGKSQCARRSKHNIEIEQPITTGTDITICP